MAAGKYSDHGRLQFYISGTRKCLALIMHAILTVWSVGRNHFVTTVSFHATLYCTLRACSLFKSSNENCGLLHKWLTTSPRWTACNQLTINTPFHSLRRERALPYFVLGEEERGRNTSGQPELRAQHESSTGLPTSRLRATAHTKSSSLWPWLHRPLLVLHTWICTTIRAFYPFEPEQKHPPSSCELTLPQDQPSEN